MWTDLKQQLETLPQVNLIDRHPTREITVRVDSGLTRMTERP